jgi:nitrate reductase NapE
MLVNAMNAQLDDRASRRREAFTFFFLTVVLAPVLAVGIVGGYGFLVWMYQIVTGPPKL